MKIMPANTSGPNKIILGIDPGSRKMGFGVISVSNQNINYIDSGVFIIPLHVLQSDELSGNSEFSYRLGFINTTITNLIAKYKPSYFAIEDIFVHKNASSALKLGHARGAAIVAAVNNNIKVFEYSARLVKQSVVGKGAADKYQVQQMVRILLNMGYLPKTDEADALAIAICHAHTHSHNQQASKNIYTSEQYANKLSTKLNSLNLLKSRKFSRGRWK